MRSTAPFAVYEVVDGERICKMRKLVTAIKILLLMDIVIFAVVFPYAWLLRDGLGPDMVMSHGFLAVKRAFMGGVWLLPVSAIWLHTVGLLLSRRISKGQLRRLNPTVPLVAVWLVISVIVTVFAVMMECC